jgi:hypothetical protein
MGHFFLTHLCRRLLQSNRTAADALLTLANKAASAQPNDWAAKLLVLAQSHGMTTNEQILVAARVAIFSGAPLITNTAHAEVQRIAEIRQLATDLHAAKGTVAAKGARSTSTLPEGRSAPAARVAFNNPTHWQESANLIVPNVANLVGKSELAWRAVTSKFKGGLAEKLFDANVRGGALAVMSVMSAEGSLQTLTIHDLTALQYVAITDGNKPKLAVPLETPTLHDTFHSAVGYGVSVREEMFGDAFSEDMVNSLFGDDADIRVNLNTPLDQQPDAVKQIKLRIAENFSSATTDKITGELRSLFQSLRKNEDGFAVHTGQWTGTAIENAKRAERTLEANGLLAHLNPAGRQKIEDLIYGTEQTGSFEAIASRFVSSKDTRQFERELEGWLGQMTSTLRTESKAQGMSLPEFERKAARAVAFALVLERAAPGSLGDGPLSIGLNDEELAPALRTLDLRIDFAKTLREVQTALGQQP